MPLPKPHKGESEDDYMKRCMAEAFGDDAPDDRTQEQAVAMCLQNYRDNKPKKAASEYADPGYQPDGKKRIAIDTTDAIRAAWHAINKTDNQKPYTPAQVGRIKTRIAAAWKTKIHADGPPAADDKPALAALRRAVVLAAKADAPDPDEGESHDDFIDRCSDEMADDSDMGDDEIEEACQLAWEESNGDDDDRGGPVMFKTKATAASGMEFVLSDATPDRFGDVIEAAGWDVDNFKNNPIALFAHDKQFVIGKWTNVRISKDDLRADLVLAPKGTSPRIDEIRKLIDADILRATSVGFRPLEYQPMDAKDPWGGTRYTKHELVECSVVAVPANPNALAVAKSLNISPATARLVFGEHANMDTTTRDFGSKTRGEHANKRGKTTTETGEHAESNSSRKDKAMLLSQRIIEGEKAIVAMQDELDKHLEAIDDNNPTAEQMQRTEELSAQIELKTRHVNSMKAIEKKNGEGAGDAGELHRNSSGSGSRPPAGLTLRKEKKVEPIDYLFRAALVRCRSKNEGVDLDVMRKKVYGDDEPTRIVCDYVLKAATAPAMTTVPTWAQELVHTVWAQFMEVLLPMSIFPRLEALGLALSFGQAGRIVIPTRNLTPSVSGSFVGEGAPIPVRQTAFASQTLTPKKMAVITTWTREMSEYSTPAIEGLLRQAVLEDTAISLDAILLDNNPATAIRPPGLRSYQAGITASAAATPFDAFVADYKALFGGLLGLTAGNVRRPAIMLNPVETLALSLMQPPAAAAPLWPLASMIAAGKLGKADLVESATVPPGLAVMIDAADFTTAGSEGPRMEISDQATLHFEDTTPLDIVSGPTGTPVAATPVKSMFQTDSLALRMIMPMNWILRRPVVSWITGVAWG